MPFEVIKKYNMNNNILRDWMQSLKQFYDFKWRAKT